MPPLIMIHTFDLFDTLVVRPWARPQRVFEELAESLATEAGVAAADRPAWRMRFREARVAAERRANRETPGEHATLDEIYERFDLPRAHGLDPAEVMRREVELEISILQPVPARVREVLDLQARGEKVLFLTDMYLPPEALVRVLAKCGIDATPADLRVSGHLKKAKWRGRLFRHVRAEFRHLRGRFHHTGDNPRSDVWIPRLLGWRSTFAADAHPNRYERRWRAATGLADAESVAGAMRAERLMRDMPGAPPALASVYANVAAPLLAGFVSWTLQTAREQGVRRLYFMARDGYLMLEIARALAKPDDPELRYLYGSRQAFFLAGTDDFTPAALSWLAPAGASKRLADLLRRLDLEYADLAGPLAAAGLCDPQKSLAAGQVASLVDTLCSPAGRTVLTPRRDARRALLRRYFAQEGLDGSVPAAVADIGWQLKTQRALRSILPPEAFPLFLYLGAAATRLPAALTGGFLAYVDERRDGRAGRALFQGASIVEQLMTPAPHGFTRGFVERADRIEPDLAPPSRLLGGERFEWIRGMYRSLASAWRATNGADLAGTGWRDIALRCAADFFTRPSKAEALALAELEVADDQNESSRVPAAAPIRAGTLARLIWQNGVLRGRKGFFRRGFIWMGGSARLSTPPIRAAYRLSVWLGLFGSRFR